MFRLERRYIHVADTPPERSGVRRCPEDEFRGVAGEITVVLANTEAIPISYDGFAVRLAGRQFERTIDALGRVDEREPKGLVAVVVDEDSGAACRRSECENAGRDDD